jgi:hypothetical protein
VTPKTTNSTLPPLGCDPCELLKGDERALLIASLIVVGDRPVFTYDKFHLFREPFFSLVGDAVYSGNEQNGDPRINFPLESAIQRPHGIPVFAFGINQHILELAEWPWLPPELHNWWQHPMVGRKDFTVNVYV